MGKSLQELSNQEFADYRSELIEQQKKLAERRTKVTGGKRTQTTKELEEVERRLMVVEKEVTRRANLAIQRGELRSPDNPDWGEREIPPCHVPTLDAFRAMVAEGAGAKGPIIAGLLGDQQFQAEIKIPSGGSQIAPTLVVAQRLHELNVTLTRLTDAVESVVTQTQDPMKLAATVAQFVRALELCQENVAKKDEERKKAEVKEQLGG